MTKFYDYISGNPYYQYHYISNNQLIVHFDGCGCGCEDYLSTCVYDIVDGIVSVNGVEYIADENI